MNAQRQQPDTSGAEPLTDRRRDEQRRDAFRVGMRSAVHVESPMQMYAELVDISILGARFDRELTCTHGVKVQFLLELPGYGANLKPDELELQAQVVRVQHGHTGLHFADLTQEQRRAVKDLVNQRQRMILAALRVNRERPPRDGRRHAKG